MDQNFYRGRFFDPFVVVCGKMDQYLLVGIMGKVGEVVRDLGNYGPPDSFLENLEG